MGNPASKEHLIRRLSIFIEGADGPHGEKVKDYPLTNLLRDVRAYLQEPGNETPIGPLAKRCYVMSESHLSGYRVVIGFSKLDDASEAHEWIARGGRGFPAETSGDARRTAEYWKAEHLAGNKEIEALREEVAKYKTWAASCDPSPAFQQMRAVLQRIANEPCGVCDRIAREVLTELAQKSPGHPAPAASGCTEPLPPSGSEAAEAAGAGDRS